MKILVKLNDGELLESDFLNADDLIEKFGSTKEAIKYINDTLEFIKNFSRLEYFNIQVEDSPLFIVAKNIKYVHLVNVNYTLENLKEIMNKENAST